MKQVIKTILRVLLALLILGALVIGVSRFCFGYDLFERGGWETGKDGTVRYLNAGGEPVLGWMTLDGVTYYLDPERDGAMHFGWLDTGEGRFFLGESGARVSGWTEIDGACYCFAENGIMLTGWLDTESGRTYLNENGVRETGWVELDGSRFYFGDDGMMHIGWLDQPEGRYYLLESGAVTAQWLEQSGQRYYMNEEGLLSSGWLELDGTWYYLTGSGAAYTGWLEDGEERYYFLEDGAMAVGRVEIDGTVHHFTSVGAPFLLVNPWNPVPEGYEAELVEIQGFQVDVTCLAALQEMIAACEAAGHECKISSGYRSYERQVTLFEQKVTKLMGQGYSREAAERETALSIAIPGTSEHQLGLAVDLKNNGDTYKWLEKNSWKYGFIMRYPYGKTELTGIYYEPWHFRYVGTELAKELYDLGLCVEEYMNLLTEQAKR